MQRVLFYTVLFLVTVMACKKNLHDDPNRIVSVKNFWPNSGNAGTIVTITGTALQQIGEEGVLFNGVFARIMDRRDTVIKVLAPEGASSGMISLQNGDQKIEVGQYTFQALSLSGMSPLNGPAGTNISIQGAGFSSVTGPVRVFVNDKEAIITSVNDTLVVAAVPEAAGSGIVRVIVDGKEVAGPGFLFQHINAIKPLRGGKGTRVTIKGEGFNTELAQNHVTFNGKSAAVLSAATDSLIVEAPEEVSTGPVSVTINGQQTVGAAFTVIPPPLITAVAPLSAPAGTDVTIKGEYFSEFADEVKILFNGVPATVASTAEKTIVVKVPENAGTGEMNVTVNDQTAIIPEFKEQNLGIAAVSPENGMDGDVVTLSGIGFSENILENQVYFNGVPATISSASATELMVTVPVAFSSGAVNITVGALSAQGPTFNKAGVITLAGGPGNSNLNSMRGIAVDSKGNVFVGTGNSIRKITPDGAVSLFAGDEAAGLSDGVGAGARFSYISGLAIDNHDDLFVSDQFNSRIRKLSPNGEVTTVGTPPATPISIASDAQGNLYVGQMYNGVFLFNKTTGAFTKAVNAMYETGAFIAPVSPTHFYYAAEWDYQNIFRILNGSKSNYAGSGYGYADGPYNSAQFSAFNGLAVTGDGTLYILNGGALRKASDGMVTTVMGYDHDMGWPSSGFEDGGFSKAKFSSPNGMCVDKDGNLYISDFGNKAVRKVFFK